MPVETDPVTHAQPSPEIPAGPVSSAYNETQVQVLDGMEHVRKRPGMYIGDTTPRGLHHLVYEVVDNAVDEAMAGVCDTIEVTLHADGSVSVSDNGRGFPVGIKPEFGLPAIELCLTKLGAGAKFDRSSYKVSGGLHGVGVSVVNALSERCEVRTERDGKLHVIGFERGRTTRPLEVIGTTDRTGSKVWFKPDPDVFPDTSFDFDTLAKRLRELAYLNAGLGLTLVDERSNRREAYRFEHGIMEFVKHLNDGKTPLHSAVRFTKEDADAKLIVDAAFQYTDSYSENVLSFANNIDTHEGGTHLSGFRSALTRAINNYARKANLYKSNDLVPTGDDIREGLTAVVCVMVPEPQFEGQTKTKLGNSEVGTFVETALNEKLAAWLEEHPGDSKRIIQKAVQAAEAREAARKARETARKSALSGGGLSRKLVDCSSRNVDETELYIVEGDSAAGSAKGYRDARTQAILPIRGKILNVEKARLHKILSHEEILEIIKALGTGIGVEEFDISKLRYGRIILMTDADVDGSHIRTLLLTFFFRHMRELIDRGVIYIAQPPLYQLKKGKRAEYVIDDPALQRKLGELGLDSVELDVCRPGQPVRTLATDQVRDLLRLLDEMASHATVLARRGIEYRPFLTNHLRDGRLPRFRVQAGQREALTYDAAEAAAFIAQLSPADREKAQRVELHEAQALEQCLVRLTGFGATVADLFGQREEQVTGDLTAATFVLRAGEHRVELHNLSELPDGIRGLGSRGWEIKRFKGLGEMNKEELWETTMDPSNRIMRLVTIGSATSDPEQADIDALEADRMFSILMGEDVERRREFIETNAIHVKNLDV